MLHKIVITIKDNVLIVRSHREIQQNTPSES